MAQAVKREKNESRTGTKLEFSHPLHDVEIAHCYPRRLADYEVASSILLQSFPPENISFFNSKISSQSNNCESCIVGPPI